MSYSSNTHGCLELDLHATFMDVYINSEPNSFYPIPGNNLLFEGNIGIINNLYVSLINHNNI